MIFKSCLNCSTDFDSNSVVENYPGHFRTFKCPKCQTLLRFTVIPDDGLPIIKWSGEVQISWEGNKITNNELFELRRLLPELNIEPISKLKSKLSSAGFYRKKVNTSYIADELIKSAIKMGFRAKIMKADDRVC